MPELLKYMNEFSTVDGDNKTGSNRSPAFPFESVCAVLEGPTYYIKDAVKDLGFVWAQNIHEIAGLNRWVKVLDDADDAEGIAKDVTTIANKAGFDIKDGAADAVETWGEVVTEE